MILNSVGWIMVSPRAIINQTDMANGKTVYFFASSSPPIGTKEAETTHAGSVPTF